MSLRWRPDPFLTLLMAALVLATFAPVRGDAVGVANAISTAAIFMLFFLHGTRLLRADVWQGLRHWRLQGAIALWVFGVMALAGLALSWAVGPWIGASLALGLIYLGVLPSTVQSATAYTGMAGGNVAAAVVAAACINLAAVVISPALFALIAGSRGVTINGDLVLRIAMILLLPFALGQLLQRWLRPLTLEYRSIATWLDRTAIAIAVYVAFSAAVTQGIWAQTALADLVVLIAALLAYLGFALAGAWQMGGLIGLERTDRITMLFAGSQKSLAVGAPLAAILFAPDKAGFILLPVLIYHQLQLILSAPIANRLGHFAA